MLNPYGGGQRDPLNPEESVAWIQEYWRRHYNRTLDLNLLHATESLDKVLEFWHDYLVEDGARPYLIAAAERCRQRALVIADRRHDSVTGPVAVEMLHQSMLPFIQDSDRRGQFRNLLSRLSPFALAGVAAPAARFFMIGDRTLYGPDSKNYMAIDRDLWIEAFPEAEFTYVDVDQFTNWEWSALDQLVAVRTLQGAEQIRWHPHLEMNSHQELFMRTHPQILHDYIQHIAAKWQSQFHRRPRVYLEANVALLPWSMQPLIDPGVDLAAAPQYRFKHNDWILPMDRHSLGLSTSAEVKDHRQLEAE